jgi:hypothetical protein
MTEMLPPRSRQTLPTIDRDTGSVDLRVAFFIISYVAVVVWVLLQARTPLHARPATPPLRTVTPSPSH